jgi:hypothetical protein
MVLLVTLACEASHRPHASRSTSDGRRRMLRPGIGCEKGNHVSQFDQLAVGEELAAIQQNGRT